MQWTGRLSNANLIGSDNNIPMIGPELRCRGLPCGVLRLMSRIDLCKAIWVKAAIWKILLIFVFFFFPSAQGLPGHSLFVRNIFAVRPVSKKNGEFVLCRSCLGLIHIAANYTATLQGYGNILFKDVRKICRIDGSNVAVLVGHFGS